MIRVFTGSGGGYGDPRERDPELVRADVRNGLLSPQRARDVYGVDTEEFGGIWWNPEVAASEDSWGYGERPRTLEEFYDRFERLCAVLLDNPNMFGYCYTQLTDIYQEQNGVYKFDRAGKFDLVRLRAAQQRAAAIEQRSDS